jgi:hypothetical protein
MNIRDRVVALSNELLDVSNIGESEIEERDEVKKLSEEAVVYLNDQTWCTQIEKGWVGEEWGGILSIFLFKVLPSSRDIDDYVWVVVGDIPPAYIDIESAESVDEVLESYVYIMSEWVKRVEKGQSVDDWFPVSVPPEKKYAEMLKRRLTFIKNNILSA